jgi:hypothetical protein
MELHRKKILEMYQDAQQQENTIAERQRSRLPIGASSYATLSTKYVDIHNLVYQFRVAHPPSYDYEADTIEYSTSQPIRLAIENITRAIALAKDPELCLYRAQRAEMYLHKSNSERDFGYLYCTLSLLEVEEDLDYIRAEMSNWFNSDYPLAREVPALNHRTYIKSVYEKVAPKLEQVIILRRIDNLNKYVLWQKEGRAYEQDWLEDAKAYKQISVLYLTLFKSDGEPKHVEQAFLNIDRAIEIAKDDQEQYFQLLENRADMYIEAHEYEKAEHDIASLRNQVSTLIHPDKIASTALKSESILDELVSIQFEFTPLFKQIAELNEQMRPLIEKKDELYTRQRKLTSQMNEINQAKKANKSASDVLSMVAETLEEKLASHLALRTSASNQSPQRGGRVRRANRSPPLIRSVRRM